MQGTEQVQKQTAGTTGIKVRMMDDGRLMVVRLAEGSPARVSGKVKAGDVLLSIDGTEVTSRPTHNLAFSCNPCARCFGRRVGHVRVWLITRQTSGACACLVDHAADEWGMCVFG